MRIENRGDDGWEVGKMRSEEVRGVPRNEGNEGEGKRGEVKGGK